MNAVKGPMLRDNKKRDLLEWASFNRDLQAHHEVYATGTTGGILERHLGFEIRKLQSGPLGGDQQIGAKIVSKEIDFLICFRDPLEPQLSHCLGWDPRTGHARRPARPNLSRTGVLNARTRRQTTVAGGPFVCRDAPPFAPGCRRERRRSQPL